MRLTEPRVEKCNGAQAPHRSPPIEILDLQRFLCFPSLFALGFSDSASSAISSRSRLSDNPRSTRAEVPKPAESQSNFRVRVRFRSPLLSFPWFSVVLSPNAARLRWFRTPPAWACYAAYSALNVANSELRFAMAGVGSADTLNSTSSIKSGQRRWSHHTHTRPDADMLFMRYHKHRSVRRLGVRGKPMIGSETLIFLGSLVLPALFSLHLS